MKARYSTFLADKEKLATFLTNRQEEIDEEMERQRLESKQEQQREEECLLTELYLRQEEHERRMRQEKMDAELEAKHKRLELEKRSLFNQSKTAQTTNNTTQGNAHQLGEIREHVCYTSPKQIDQRSDLLEMVNPKVRAKIMQQT